MDERVTPVDHPLLRSGEMPPLAMAIAFRCDDVVYKFLDYYDVSFDVASTFFSETRKWLWLCARSQCERGVGGSVPDLAITAPLFWLDEMWHAFLQFTRQYQEFCLGCCGMFIHHVPTPHEEKAARREAHAQDPRAFLDQRADELRRQCIYIREHLGEDTLRRWYCDFAEEYSAEKLQDRSVRRRPVF
jgi:hypothetical protein